MEGEIGDDRRERGRRRRGVRRKGNSSKSFLSGGVPERLGGFLLGTFRRRGSG